ncbi:hypothetical protein JANAI62_20320 [Jannaschia pagri]|uniref:Peptidase M16 C-terminal domain-containing protein n=1 Tax=Jannaschia pagri TaxID=2829797 RepID=A0ABQ4NLW5_9RHOB|nr:MULTISPECIES: insulinase family protein [unclassified Jannaschia]GIT91575.1 hypothetical protein JANAI61_20330 [Jannaschia sp. AI_61]GIT95409.1 hypothetical protein JANAI62_20320 [Jannaschia sp. AI_62]
MKHLVSAVAVTLLLASCREAGPAADQVTSPAGHSYVHITLPGAEDVTVQVAWATDWAKRQDRAPATPYLGADLILMGGTADHAPGQAGEVFADLGSLGRLTASADHIIGDLTFTPDTLVETVSIANAHLRAPSLDDAWFLRLRDGLADTMAEAKTRPAHVAYDVARWAILGDRPVRRSLSLDDPRDVTETTREDVRVWHDQTILRAPEAIVVAGDIPRSQADAAVDGLLQGLPTTPGPARVATIADFTPRRILLHDPNADSTYITFVAQLPTVRGNEGFADLMIVDALTAGDRSVLFEAVRTRLRASYGFRGELARYGEDVRLFALSGGVETARLAEVEAAVRDAYGAFREAGSLSDLSERKQILADSLAEARTDTAQAAYGTLRALLQDRPPETVLTLGAMLDGVDDASIATRLQQVYPVPDGFVTIAVSADADALPGACVITQPAAAVDCP